MQEETHLQPVSSYARSDLLFGPFKLRFVQQTQFWCIYIQAEIDEMRREERRNQSGDRVAQDQSEGRRGMKENF